MAGLFDLTGFESMQEGDLMNMKLTEGTAEFQDHCPSMDPTQHFDADNSGNKQVSVPCGDKETPCAKPEGGEKEVPVPGGDKETPTAKPEGGEQKIPVPAKVTLDANTYNAALEQLQKSFKEGFELMGMIRNAQVIHESVEDRQEQYTEDAIGTAIVESFENGPMFEAVDRSDKEEVKKIVSDLRSKVAKALKEDDVFFRVPNVWAQILVGAALTPFGVGSATFARGLSTAFSTRLWQILGLCYMEDGNINKYCEELTKKFSEQLGEYKILAAPVIPSLADMFRMKFGWKNQKNSYMLLVDKKVPSEIKKAQEEIAAELEKAKKEAEEKKDDKK